MAVKRKSSDDGSVSPSKRPRAECVENSPDSDYHSDDDLKDVVNFTDNGERRADSEARRQWNYICPVEGCEQRFNRPCRLDTHMRSHTKERPYACSEPGCDKTFPRKDHLQRHVKNAHSDPDLERVYACDWPGCGKSFTSNGRLQRHRDVHESKFYCTAYPPCNEAFRKEKALEAHIKSQHEEMKPYPCTYIDPDTHQKCSSAYQTESALQRHIHKKHSEKEEAGLTLFCMICAQPALGDEVEEVEITQDGDLTDTQKMPLAFTNQEDLQAHIKACHPPVCSVCGQQFKQHSSLKSHFDTFHGDPSQQRRFPCPEPNCDSVFNRKHNLSVHIQTVHEQQARYICTAEAHQNSKHEDLRAWSGENACGAAFKAKSSLDQHVRTHHLGLGNRKQVRKAAKSKKKPEASMLSMLTGVGYEKTREVPCLVKDCEFRFYMDRDLRRHLRATHNVPDEEVDELIAERDALSGGQFWIGGLDDSMGLFESAEPSMPQTPAPYFVEGVVPSTDVSMKRTESQFNIFDQQYDELSLLKEEEELDLAMGLGDIAPATDVHEGLQWDMLAPVGQFNMEH